MRGFPLLLCAALLACQGPAADSTSRSETGGYSAIARPSRGPVLVSFPTADGGEVSANLYGVGVDGLVLAHGGRFDRNSWAKQASRFAEEGFLVLSIDFRGRGQSHGPGAADDEDHLSYDVRAAVEYLRDRGVRSVSVVGASLGGWAAAQAMVEAPGQIDRLVLMASPPIEQPEQLVGRKLFLTTREDFRGEGTLRLPSIQDQFDRAPEPKELVILEGDAHAQAIFDTEQGERALEEILRFLTAP